MRELANGDLIWIGVYCGELKNFNSTIRDANAKVITTFPVNSRDSYTYISKRVYIKSIERIHYKHWLINGSTIRNTIDDIYQCLLDNDVVDGNVETNNKVIEDIIDKCTTIETEEVKPAPEIIDSTYNFDEISKYEYYYKKSYRKILEDKTTNRLYFITGRGRGRQYEYILPDSLNRSRKRIIEK